MHFLYTTNFIDMKIIWITSVFPNSNGSTAGIYLYRTVKALSKYYDITTICIFPASPPIFNMIEKPLQLKKTYSIWLKNHPKKPSPPKDLAPASVYYVRYWRLPKRLFNHFEGYFAYLKTKKIIKNLITNDTVLHANWIFPSGQLANIIAKKYNIPYTVSLLGSDVHNLKFGTYYWNYAKEVINNAKIICSVSHQLIEKCIKEKIKINLNKVQYIDNIYDENTFCIRDRNIIMEKISISKNNKIIFYAGGLDDIKNIDTLIKAFYEILKIGQNCELFIAGSGFEENYLKNLIEQLGLDKSVNFLGNLLQDDLISYMNVADVFCLPSKNEGTPNVVIESLLCGTPVIASNVGGIPALIKHGENGYLFEPLNIIDLTNLLIESLNRNWDRQKIRKSAERFYSSTVIKKYHTLYKMLGN